MSLISGPVELSDVVGENGEETQYVQDAPAELMYLLHHFDDQQRAYVQRWTQMLPSEVIPSGWSNDWVSFESTSDWQGWPCDDAWEISHIFHRPGRIRPVIWREGDDLPLVVFAIGNQYYVNDGDSTAILDMMDGPADLLDIESNILCSSPISDWDNNASARVHIYAPAGGSYWGRAALRL